MPPDLFPSPPTPPLAPLGRRDRLARRALAWPLGKLETGVLTIRDADGTQRFGNPDPTDGLAARITVFDPAFYARTLLGGSVGAAESFMDGDWRCDDLAAFFRILARNERAVIAVETRVSRITWPLRRVRHALHRNTQRGSRRNVSAHYDLGNEFYELFLDPTLTYSSAVVEHPDVSLEVAQRAKYDRICRKLALGPDDHLLEIGSGWGGMAIHAARHFGCRVTTTTISREQLGGAQRRVAAAGLADRVEVIFEDYRRLRGTFDKLVSIEMVEAVGHRYLPEYLRVCGARLKPDGLMCLQAITTPDQRYRLSLHNTDFIKAYIFPGGQLPSLEAILAGARKTTDLRVVHIEDIGPHYAWTLRRWREAFYKNLDAVREIGFSEAFIRMWEFYLASCEGAFAERYVGNAQIVFAKPGARRAPILGALS